MEMNIKFKALADVLETLEDEINTNTTWREQSQQDYDNRKKEITEEEEDEERREYRIENDWQLGRSKEDVETRTVRLEILEYLKKHLYDNFQKIVK